MSVAFGAAQDILSLYSGKLLLPLVFNNQIGRSSLLAAFGMLIECWRTMMIRLYSFVVFVVSLRKYSSTFWYAVLFLSEASCEDERVFPLCRSC